MTLFCLDFLLFLLHCSNPIFLITIYFNERSLFSNSLQTIARNQKGMKNVNTEHFFPPHRSRSFDILFYVHSFFRTNKSKRISFACLNQLQSAWFNSYHTFQFLPFFLSLKYFSFLLFFDFLDFCTLSLINSVPKSKCCRDIWFCCFKRFFLCARMCMCAFAYIKNSVNQIR